jgi:hypothetical protein
LAAENSEKKKQKQPLSPVDGDRYYTHWADIAARRTHEAHRDAEGLTVA